MENRKPIFIVKAPIESLDNVDLQEHLEAQIGNDYYVLVCSTNVDEVEFECFNHNLDEKQFEELKEIAKGITI